MMSDGAGQTQPRSRLLTLPPAIFEIRDGDHPYRFQHGDNQIARQAAGPSYLRIAKRAATL